MRRILLPSIGAFVLALVLAPQAFADQQLVVDKDKVQCPHADHTSIQAAVNAAAAGGTILVCPDVYNEHVLIATPAKNGLTIRARGRPEEVVLDGLNTMMHGFELENVSGVLIEGFHVTRYHDDIWLNPDADGNTIRRNMTTFAFDHDGIVVQGDRNVIEHNRSFGNTQPISCGISVGSGGSFNIVRFNETYNNPNTGILLGGGLLGPAGPGNEIVHNHSHDNGKPLAGIAGGTGILNAISPGALIAHNRVHDNNRHGILVTGAQSTNVVIAHNVVLHNGSTNEDDGIRLAGGAANNSVRHNESSSNRHDGIRITESNGNVVEHNLLVDNGTDGAANGCGVDVDTGAANNVIRHNLVRLHDRAGIRLRNAGTGNLVEHNLLLANPGDGVLLVNTNATTIARNVSTGNGRDGIRVEPTSSGNTIERNVLTGNAEHDCHDDTTGSGTAGTANLWIGNIGRTENRPGLCGPV